MLLCSVGQKVWINASLADLLTDQYDCSEVTFKVFKEGEPPPPQKKRDLTPKQLLPIFLQFYPGFTLPMLDMGEPTCFPINNSVFIQNRRAQAEEIESQIFQNSQVSA